MRRGNRSSVRKGQQKAEPQIQESNSQAVLAAQNDSDSSMLEALLISKVKNKLLTNLENDEQMEHKNDSNEAHKVEPVTNKAKEPSPPRTNQASEFRSMPDLLDINDNSNDFTTSMPPIQVSRLNTSGVPAKKVLESKKTVVSPKQVDLKSANSEQLTNTAISSGNNEKVNLSDLHSVNKPNPESSSPNSNSSVTNKPKPGCKVQSPTQNPPAGISADSQSISKSNLQNPKDVTEDKSRRREHRKKWFKSEVKPEMVYVAAGVKEDCENLIQKCLQVYRLNFEKFCEIWKEMSFVSIFSPRQSSAELAELSEEVIYIAKGYMLANNKNFEENVAGLFLVYAFLNQQPYKGFAALRLIPSDVPTIKYLETEARRQRRHDIIYILGAVLIKGPCHCHVLLREVALEIPYKKYFDGSIHPEVVSGVLARSGDIVQSFRNVMRTDTRYGDRKAMLAARFSDGKMTGTKQVGMSMFQEFQQLANNARFDVAEDVNTKETKSQVSEESRHDLVSTIKAKAMANVVDPIKHLTGVEERQQEKLQSSPPKQDDPNKSPGKGKGKGKGKSKSWGRCSATTLNNLFNQPANEIFLDKTMQTSKKNNIKLCTILAMTDTDLEVTTSQKKRSHSPNKEDEHSKKRRNNSENDAKNAENQALNSGNTINLWLNSKSLDNSKISEGVSIASSSSVNDIASAKNTSKTDSTSVSEIKISPQEPTIDHKHTDDISKPSENTPNNIPNQLDSKPLDNNKVKTANKPSKDTPLEDKQKTVTLKVKQIVRKKKKPKPKPVTDSESDIDSDEIDKMIDFSTQLIQEKTKSMQSTEPDVLNPSLIREDSEDLTNNLETSNTIETEREDNTVKNKLRKIINDKVKQKTILEMVSADMRKRRNSKDIELDSPTKRITRSNSLEKSPATTSKSVDQIKRKKLQKRDLKRMRVKSAFKRLGILEVASMGNSSDP